MNIHRFYAAVFPYFRRRRMTQFAASVGLTAETTVLDVGGHPDIWSYCPVRPRVTFLNTYELPGVALEDQLVADGCAIPLPDKSFDIAFSNSVIEHVGDQARQKAFAGELQRVGRLVWCQTPDRTFPIELHLLAPFVHWLPETAFKTLGPKLAVRALFSDTQSLNEVVQQLRLLSRSELAEFFPTADIRRERFLGWPKSLIALTHH